MVSKLHFKFDPNQEYQLTAINSIVKVFDGLPRYEKKFALEDIFPNLPPDESIYEDFLLENLNAVQRDNQIPESQNLEVDDGLVMESTGYESWRSPSFTVEMETGTGKTYVYLRTIYELYKHYGFSKFIIVVPSVAIYEGVRKTFEITKSHFSSLYGNEVVNLILYDGAQIGTVRSFATSSFIQIMVITIASFNSIKNNLYKRSEKLPGERIAYQYIQEVRPILILDEPQSIDNTETAKEAIRSLHPLFILRYSATHRVRPNLVYNLTPIDAYRQNLVKKIQVIGISEEDNLNRPTLILESVTQSPITAKVKTLVEEKGTLKEVVITLKQADNLFDKTHREEHKNGYRVEEIGAAKGKEFVKFENTLTIYLKENLAPSRPEIFRFQIRETIKQHMELQEKLYPKGIKVLSLFFIDRVANYTADNGIIRSIFDQEFEQLKNQYHQFEKYSPEQVREAYFAKKITQSGEEVAVDTESKNQEQREAEKKAFELIMWKKEQLLSFDEPVSFIFAHSALKEGWDNPNVFQICTLNQTTSEIKKRQEIGRGLRLCVDQTGTRILDEQINVLTVIANESYEEYAANLQREYTEAGEEAPPKPKRPQQSKVKRKDELFNSDDFQHFWTKLCQRTKYKISVNTEELITTCINNLNAVDFPEPKIVLTKGKFIITEYIILLESVNGNQSTIVLQTRSTENSQENNSLTPLESKYTVKVGSDLSKIFKNLCLRGFKVLEIIDRGDNSVVKFADKEQTELTKYQPIVFTSEKGQTPAKVQTVQTLQDTYPVFNLVDRAAKETKLTRATLNRIFQGMSEDRKKILFKNPEGFASTFIAKIKEVATYHVVSNIEFTLDIGQLPLQIDELFPLEKKIAQKELIDAGERGLYDQVQIDSDVERDFVQYRLLDDQKVVLYFKFPPLLKVKFPKVIGNYNPDWGIIRRGDNGNHILQLVRETKGKTDIEKLQYVRETFKIKCATKHFRAVGIDYRVIDDKVINWWVSEAEINQTQLF
ncbi:restriction endonuclease [Nostoc sp.]|uniref:restriction endonuclease n=1 Tax=Nostoc sp. TaxID=1180 RepID=UPI002FFD4F77